jgi:DNA-binding response OmpR family regulator
MDARVLIVDDDESIREMLAVLFEAKDASAEKASSGEDALVILAKQEFDLLLVDKNMPGISGVELIRLVRAKDDDVSIVMMTAFASAESIVDTLNLGVDAYVEKPFPSVFELVKTCEEILERKSRPPPEKPKKERLRALAAVSLESQRDRIRAALADVPTDLDFMDTEAELLEDAQTGPDLVILDADAWNAGSPEVVSQLGDIAPRARVAVFSSGFLENSVLEELIALGVLAFFDWNKDWAATLADAAARVLEKSS